MIIERIAIGSFGNLSDVSFEFGPGVNVITGQNESGKSMVAAFIRYMLYGFGTYHAANDLPEREKRVSWQSGTAEGSMDISLSDGRRFRIERRTEAIPQAGRIGYREESRLVDLSDGSVMRFTSLPGEEFFAVPEQVYTNTAYFGQLSGSRLNESEMAQAMENLLFSGDERVSSQRALQTMHEARRSLSHSSGVAGAIYELAAQTDATRLRLTQEMRKSNHIHKTETELHKLSERIANAEAERDRLSEVDTYYRAYLTICSFDKLHEIENTYATLVAERETLRRENGNGGFLPDEEYLTSLKTAERVTEIARQNYLRTAEKVNSVKEEGDITPEQKELARRTDEAGGASAVEAEYTRLHRLARRQRATAWTFLVLALLFLGLALFLLRPLTLTPVTALLGIAVLSSAVFSCLCFRGRFLTVRSIRSLCRRFDSGSGAELLCRMKEVEATGRLVEERRESILRAEENAEISRMNFENFRSELVALADKWSRYPIAPAEGRPYEAIESISVHARAFLDEDRRLSEEIAEVRGRMTALREELAGESEIAIRAQVPPPRREAMKKINYKTILEGLTYYRATCETFHAQYEDLLRELNEARRTAANPALIRSDLALMEERLSALRRRYRSYGIALDAIGNASDRLRAEISPRLSAFSGNLLSAATDGRYGSLEVTNRLSMAYRDGEELRPLPGLSDSTCEIAYISLRLALIDMLYEEMPPLCFDESLAHQDDGRLSHIIKLLDTVAIGGMQSILLSCHEREAEIAARVSEGARCFTL